MEKRLLLAVTLSIIVMLVYPFFIAKISPPPAESDLLTQSVMQPIEQQEVVKTQPMVIEDEPSSSQPPIDIVSESVEGESYILDISDVGGSIQKIKIKDGKRCRIDLVEKAFYQAGVFSIEGKGELAGLSSQLFAIKEDTRTLYIEKDGLAVEKSFRFLKDRYALHSSIKIKNTSFETKDISFEITTASNISDKEIYESRYIVANVLYKDGSLKRIARGNSKDYKRLYANNIEWLGLSNKYYSILARPEFTPSGVFTKSINSKIAIGFIVANDRILPAETRIYNILLYIGPTEAAELESVDRSFVKALNFGVFTGISLMLLSVLRFFHSIFHNYGVAILLLTCCVSLLLFPLSFKSLRSMRKLQELQPHIEKVRTQYKENPKKLNKEIMEIYRRYKVNPMGGCFPMLLQMPIFIALYQTLMKSVELKGAHFLWIKDLSMPDRAFHLPFSLPFFGDAINLLPILMIGAMIVQQRLSQVRTGASQTEQQKMMANLMPIMFGFIFYSLPSGLVLYWLTNTVFTSSMHFFFLRKS